MKLWPMARPRRPIVLACVSAAEARGLQLLRPSSDEHRWVPRHAGGPIPPGVRLHRARPFAPARGGVESVPDMLMHVAQCLPRLEALIVWESAVRAGLVTVRQLHGIPWRSLASRDLAARVSADSDSLLETLMLHRLRALGLVVVQQVRILGHRVDFVIGDRLGVQLDGLQFHQAVQRQRDVEQDGLLALEGYRVLRFGYGDVVDRWAHVEELVLATLAQLSPTPSPR